METEDCLLLSLFAVLFIASCLGGYKLGRRLEREALTDALIHQSEATYYDGYGDAEKACRMGGFK